MFEWKKKSYEIEKRNDMIHIHDKELNTISEFNLIYNIINPPKRAKILNMHYSPIIHGCNNTIIVITRFNNFQILLKSGCSSTIVMGK